MTNREKIGRDYLKNWEKKYRDKPWDISMYHIKGYIKSQELNLYGTVTKTDGLMEQ